MKISCDIIKDILPLYAEDMVSQPTKDMVNDHLAECEGCTKELEALRKPQKLPVEADVIALKRVEAAIRRRKVLTVAAAIMTMLALVVTAWAWLLTPYTLTAEEAIESVELTEDGVLVFDYARGITGKAGLSVLDDNNGMVCITTRYDWYQARKLDAMLEDMTREEIENYIAQKYEKAECTEADWNQFFNIDVTYGRITTKDGEYVDPYGQSTDDPEDGKWVDRPTDRNQWYLNPRNGSAETLLWDAGLDHPSDILWPTSCIYAVVIFGSLILGGLLYWISRGIAGLWKDILPRVSIALGSVAASTLLVTGGQLSTLEYFLTDEWNRAICMEVLVLSFTSLLWYQLHILNRKDKGM